MRHEKSIRSLCQLNGYLIFIILHKRILMSDLFVFHCQNCSKGKLIFYAGGEYKILHRQFFDGNTLQNSFFNKKVVFFFHKNSRRMSNSRT